MFERHFVYFFRRIYKKFEGIDDFTQDLSALKPEIEVSKDESYLQLMRYNLATKELEPVKDKVIVEN